MQGDAKIISYLNQYLRTELTGQRQYLLHARLCQFGGLSALAAKENAYSSEEMAHAGRLLDRLLVLGGESDMGDLEKIPVAREVQALLQQDGDLIGRAFSLLREAIDHSRSQGDEVTKTMLEDTLADEEAHFRWVETELSLIQGVGLQTYLQGRI